MSEYLNQCIHKAKQYLANASVVAATEAPAGAVTSSYYAFFWLVRGLLYEKGVTTKRNSGAREMFALHYIKPGLIPKHFYDSLELLFEKRQFVDYDIDGDSHPDEVAHLIALSTEFLNYVKQHHTFLSAASAADNAHDGGDGAEKGA